jgi:hypothetical protein
VAERPQMLKDQFPSGSKCRSTVSSKSGSFWA